MIIAVDETGDFRRSSDQKFGIVSLVTITDSEWIKFSNFIHKHFPNGFENLKGKTLSNIEREKVLKYIGSKQEIRYSAFVYDLSGGKDESVEYHKSETINRAKEKLKILEKDLNPSYINDTLLYLNQLRSYSIGDYAKFTAFTELFINWQKYFLFDYVFTNIKNDSWNLKIVVDTQNQPNKFLRLVKNTLKLTTNELNPNYRIYTPKEWPPNHPFLNNNSETGNIHRQDGNKFYKNFIIGKEEEYPELFLPDFVGHTIQNSILKRNEKKWLKNLKRVKPNRSLSIKNKNSESYYKIIGFDRDKDSKDILLELKEHYNLMREI